MSGFKQLIHEVHRRSLWQVLLIYVGAAWACYELIDTITSRFGLPGWLPALAVVLFLLGLPFVVATALVHEEPERAPTPPEEAKADAKEFDAKAAARREAATRHRFLTARNAGLSFVVALAVWGIVATGWLVLGGRTGDASAVADERPSIAVLPLANRSGVVEDEWFADGITEDIRSRLGEIGGVMLKARASAMRYEDTDKTVAQIGEELGVDYLLGGTIRWDKTGQGEGRVRIVPELIRVADAAQLWTSRYDTAYSGILDLPADIAERVAEALGVGLPGAEREAVRARPTENVEAYTLWLQGNYEVGRVTVPAFRQALEHYQEAIAISPTYAPAHSGMAMALIELGSWWSSLAPGVVHSQARTAALEALELDSTLAEAHIALGRVKHLFEWDWAGAEAAFRRGVAMNPSATHARIIYVSYLISMGRFEEAVAIGRQTLERDPLSHPAHRHVGWALDRLGRDAEALEHYQRALELAPDVFPSHLRLVEFHLRRGRLDEASRHVERAESLLGAALSPASMAHFGYYYARLNRRADALRILNELKTRAEKEYVDPNAPAVVHLGLDQKEKALELLEKGYETRSVTSVWLKARWLFDSIRDEPRFQDLLRRMNFPD